MPTAEEAAQAKTQLGGDLAAGVNTLSLDQAITFTKYVRLALPLDNFLFWVRADHISPSALYNASALNLYDFNLSPEIEAQASILTVKGSFHYATVTNQNEDETIAVNQCVFTALSEVKDFQDIAPNVMFIGEFDGIRFSFSSRGKFYRVSDLYHYTGNAIYPPMASQIIDDPRTFDGSLVVSNSLPIWLSLNSYRPVYDGGFFTTFQLYPSFAVPDNIVPPYGAVHIFPERTNAIQGAPALSSSLSHSQLARDTVRITLYGVRNAEALTFQDCVNQYSLDTDNIGIINIPIMRDEKRTQNELNILAMKKTYEVDVSYNQGTVRNVARTMILSAIPTFYIED